nr:LOW QUALITY PROTEIN: alpha-1,4-N-acetylglucosaminyltransferase [Loxodonta africana]
MLKELQVSLLIFLLLACGFLYQLILKSSSLFSCLPTYKFPQGPEALLSHQRSIVFLETSERMEPPPLVSCAVESAARVYPEQPVVFFMKGLNNSTQLPPHATYPAFSLLSAIDNVFLFPLDMKRLFEDTPLFSWYTQINTSTERNWLHVSSDASRLAIIWKYGGIYMDTDVISIRPIPEENFLAAQASQDSSYYSVWDTDPSFNDSYALHLWNHMNQEGRVVVRGSNTLVENLYRKHCPTTYRDLIQGPEESVTGNLGLGNK